MKKNVFVVCDLEEDYASKFLGYITQKRSVPFEIHAFTSVENMIAFGQKTHIELLLISEKAMNEKVKELKIGKIVILSEGVYTPELDNYASVYKYQSSANIVREVMASYGEEQIAAAVELPVLKKTTEVLGVYSPLGRCLKTSVALAMGQILSKEHAVLYLNLEGFSGLDELFHQKADSNLSDLLYFVRQENQNLIYKMSSMIRSIQNMDYIPPVQNPADIQDVTSQDWERLLNEIIQHSSYEIIVLDIGNDIRNITPILERCNKIYMPVLNDVISKSKINQFENYLRVWDLSQILMKIEKIKPPVYLANSSDEYLSQLVWSEFGDYIRELLREEPKYESENLH